MDNTLKYAMKLAFLNQLYGKKLITDKEYNVIKSDLMKKHKIVSEQGACKLSEEKLGG